MASLSDEQLQALIDRLDVNGMKVLLKKAGVTIGSDANREKLAWRVFASIRMGLEVIPTTDEEDKEAMREKQRKLEFSILDKTISLPNPLIIPDSEWELGPTNFPNLMESELSSYFSAREFRCLKFDFKGFNSLKSSDLRMFRFKNDSRHFACGKIPEILNKQQQQQKKKNKKKTCL